MPPTGGFGWPGLPESVDAGMASRQSGERVQPRGQEKEGGPSRYKVVGEAIAFCRKVRFTSDLNQN